MAIDIKTHSLSYGNTKSWKPGQFGFLTTVEKDNLSSLRIVQIGWAIGDSSQEHPLVHDRIVIPDGFEITAEATNKHRISHELATSTGHPLRDALRSMIDEVLECCARGGRIVAHHLTFHAGIISEELGRSGLAHLKERWGTAVRDGLCTMNPDIAEWARGMMGIYEIPRSIPMRLSDMVKGLITDAAELCNRHHSAGNDALVHLLVCRELLSRCRLGAAAAT